MEILATGAFKVTDGEVITIDVKSTGATTLFGVNYRIFGVDGQISAGQPLQLTMDKSKATGNSFVPGAKSTGLRLVFSFSSTAGGNYDLTVSGSGGGPSASGHATQVGNTPESIPYTFHIV